MDGVLSAYLRSKKIDTVLQKLEEEENYISKAPADHCHPSMLLPFTRRLKSTLLL